VLIRALEPISGIAAMMRRRHQTDIRKLCAGPGQLAQALAVTSALNGRRIDSRPFRLVPASIRPTVVRGARIGISKAIELKWRFGLAGSAFLSRPFR
jgi:DNA-3-methyladenine glycosylase